MLYQFEDLYDFCRRKRCVSHQGEGEMKKLIAVLSSLLLWASVAHAQIPVRGNTGQFGQVSAGLNGVGLMPWSNEGFTQGSWMSFNNKGGSNGETDFINYHPTLTGGFSWYSPTTTLGSPIMDLDHLGNLTATSFVGPLTGNVTGNLSGNAVGTSGQFGKLLVACNGCGGVAWTPGAFTSGSWLAQGNKGGSNLETDFINYATSGVQGFAWWSPSSGTIGSPTMSLDASGNLTVNQVVGNASTASALAANPTDCTTPNTFGGQIAANGNLTCFAPVSGKTTTVTSTGTGAASTASTSVPLSSTMPDTNYTASCSLVGASGAPYVQSITKGTTAITVTISNGQGSQAVASGASEIDCTVAGT
jgi:hypothetical protein